MKDNKVKSAREMFKASGIAKMTNTKVLKYGKIAEDIAYEIVETNSYTDEEINKRLCILSFVMKKDDKYVYDSDKCVMGSFQKIMEFISQCKEEKKIIKKGEL